MLSSDTTTTNAALQMILAGHGLAEPRLMTLLSTLLHGQLKSLREKLCIGVPVSIGAVAVMVTS